MVLDLGFLERQILEIKRLGFVVNDHCDLIIEFHGQPVRFKLLDEADHQAHVLVLEDYVRAIKFLLVLQLEGGAHRIARRHDDCRQFFQVKRRVKIRTRFILEHYVYSLVYDGEVTCYYLLVVEDDLVGEDKRLVTG